MNKYQASSNSAPEPPITIAWLPALLGLTVVCFESTSRMSGANTARWLLDLCHALWGHADVARVETVNLLLRKVGHFLGYGTLSLLFRHGWYSSLRRSWQGSRSRLPFSAAALAVICTFGVASLDELHQRILLGRTSSIYDVLIDTTGAIVFNRIFMLLKARRRRKLLAS